MFNGCKSLDFFTHGLENKWRFFDGFDIERIVYVDVHEPLPDVLMHMLADTCDRLVLSKHSKYYRGAEPFGPFNDVNYLHALALTRGEIVVHFDQDVAAYAKGPSHVGELLSYVTDGTFNFVSLPSPCSPDPVRDDSFGGKWWCSTRFFMCRRERIDLTALEHAIRDPQWAYETYGRPPREHGWTEHLLPLIAGYGTFYPPVDFSKLCIFPWSKYKAGTLEKLNNMEFHEITAAMYRAGGAGALYDGIDANLLNL